MKKLMIKKHFKEVLEVKMSPQAIAMGFAIGTLIAILPTMGLGIFIGLLVLLVLKRISKISMFISFAIWNPIVLTILYPIEYWIGDMVLPNLPIINFKLQVANQLFLYTRRFLFGSFLLSIFLSIISYVVVLIIVSKYQKKKIKSLKEELILAEEELKI